MRIEKKTLKNNLRALLVHDVNSPSVTILALVGIGSRYENKNASGLAHFVEHTIFKGTSKRPTSRKIGMDIELLGGTSNAFTSYDYTGYYIKVPKHNAMQAFEILTDMVKNSLFAETEIEKERGVISEEIRMYEDIPRAKIRQIFNSTLFRDNPLGRDIAGSIKSVAGLKRETFLEFVEENYTGENLLLSLGGGFDITEVESFINDNYGDLSAGKKATFEKMSRVKLKKKVKFTTKKLEQTHIVMGGFGYQRNFEKRFAYQVGNAMLSSGFGSRLFQVLRDELGLAYYVSSAISSFADIGRFTISMGVDNSKAVKAINAVINELNNLKSGNFSGEELKRAKNFLIGSLTTQLETSDDVASWYGLMALLKEEFLTSDEIIKKIAKVSQDEVIEVWREVLNNDNLLITGLGPKSKVTGKDISDID
ncbi:MAG: M16 family metallopeptidase [Candidatus Dojkabacteria bacterium]